MSQQQKLTTRTPKDRVLFSPEEAAARLKTSVSDVIRQIRNGTIVKTDFHGLLAISLAEIERVETEIQAAKVANAKAAAEAVSSRTAALRRTERNGIRKWKHPKLEKLERVIKAAGLEVPGENEIASRPAQAMTAITKTVLPADPEAISASARYMQAMFKRHHGIDVPTTDCVNLARIREQRSGDALRDPWVLVRLAQFRIAESKERGLSVPDFQAACTEVRKEFQK